MGIVRGHGIIFMACIIGARIVGATHRGYYSTGLAKGGRYPGFYQGIGGSPVQDVYFSGGWNGGGGGGDRKRSWNYHGLVIAHLRFEGISYLGTFFRVKRPIRNSIFSIYRFNVMFSRFHDKCYIQELLS